MKRPASTATPTATATAAGDAAGAVSGRAGKARGEPADFGGAQSEGAEDQAQRQGFDRQRLDPQDQPPATERDRGNLAGEKDFELGPGS